jgi:hypothetical protein
LGGTLYRDTLSSEKGKRADGGQRRWGGHCSQNVTEEKTLGIRRKRQVKKKKKLHHEEGEPYYEPIWAAIVLMYML